MIVKSPLLVILEEVAQRRCTLVSDLQSSEQSAFLALSRGEYAYHAMVRTSLPITAIGKRINRSRHTVASLVMSYCNLHKLDLPRGLEWKSLREKRNKKAPARERQG